MAIAAGLPLVGSGQSVPVEFRKGCPQPQPRELAVGLLACPNLEKPLLSVDGKEGLLGGGKVALSQGVPGTVLWPPVFQIAAESQDGPTVERQRNAQVGH